MTLPRLHVVTDDGVLARPDFLGLAMSVLESGGAGVALHIRGPRTDGRTLFDITSRLAAHAGASKAMMLVNDRVDVALACGLVNAHLGGRSLGVTPSRRILGPGSVVGVSCHTEDDVRGAAREGADYVFVGTLFRTPSHPDRAPAGVELVSAGVGVAAGCPVIGIGGVDLSNAGEVREAGAWGVAVVRSVWDGENPARITERLIDSLKSASSGGTR